jgi:hypothetical protein
VTEVHTSSCLLLVGSIVDISVLLSNNRNSVTNMTGLSVATKSNPSDLPARYEIRRLTEKEIPWISAIVIHSNMFHSPVWPVTYPENTVRRAYAGFRRVDYLIRHQVKSGHSFGIFDLDYQYKTEEAKKQGGKLSWDLDNEDVTPEQLLEQMDFPLATVAMAYDGNNPLDMGKIMELIEVLPAFGTVYHHLDELDTRDPESWKAKGPNEVLLRNATSTRHDYEGQQLMRKMANWLMRYASEQGFRGIQIECLADAVCHVWTHPPAPFEATAVCAFNTQDYREEAEVDGVKKQVNPFGAAQQRATKVYVDL